MYMYIFSIFFRPFTPKVFPLPQKFSYPPTPAGNVRFFWEFGNFYI